MRVHDISEFTFDINPMAFTHRGPNDIKNEPLRVTVAGIEDKIDEGFSESIDLNMVRALTPGVKVASALEDIWKPPVTADRAVPRVSPVRVMVMEVPAPVAAPAVVTMMVVLVDVAVVEDCKVKGVPVTLFPMAVTVPKK